jgi:hypothetical protein
METTTSTTLTAKTKAEVLLSHAERLSASYNIPFKKYIQGKNKTELLRFIEESEKVHGPLPPLSASTTTTTTTTTTSTTPSVVVKETKMTKKELILEKVRLLPGFKKSWERKSCEELRSLLSNTITTTTTTTPVPQEIQEKEEIQESGRISPIRITEYVDEEKNRMNLKEAILRAFSDAPYDDIVYPKIQQKVFTS